MSSAFVKESEEQWLHEIAPTSTALIHYLTSENNGIRVYEKSVYPHAETKRNVHVMSNGLAYSTDENSRWYIVD